MIYEGAQPWNDLKTRRRALNLILYLMGSQWSDFRTGLMCARFFVLVINRAAAFCINWSLLSSCLGRPVKSELQ